MGDSQYADWIGRSRTLTDTITLQPARFLSATLGEDRTIGAGDNLPPLWHWLYFLEAENRAGLGRDGHPQRGDFLPPVDLPRRMWAGGRFEFQHSLIIGQDATRTSTIQSVQEKQGRSGPLCFVTIRHEIAQAGTICLTEEHDIVYRDDPAAGAEPSAPPKAAPGGAEVTEQIEPDPVLLFRYSALTFNGHRIHYDRDYARDVEGYRDLVFHGPLSATLLAGLASRIAAPRTMTTFSFRAIRPLFADRTFTIDAKKAGDSAFETWAIDADGMLAMTAQASF